MLKEGVNLGKAGLKEREGVMRKCIGENIGKDEGCNFM